MKEVETENLEIKKCSWYDIRYHFLINHYLKSMPVGILMCFELVDKKNFMLKYGGAVFSNGRIQYDKKYLEFSRLWICDELGKNTESWFVSRCLKELKKTFPNYRGVVTWADPKQGHQGKIYLACNFTYDGDSRKVKKYIGKSGKHIYQRTSVKGSKQIGEDEPKKRFIYLFDSEEREKARK